MKPCKPGACDHGPVAYLDPVREELDRLRTENATLREGNRVACGRFEAAERRNRDLTQELATVRDTLRRRSNALNATGAHNDQLRAQLTRVAWLANWWASGGTANRDTLTRAAAAQTLRNEIADYLADKEPTP